jgi:hypothetical protein
VDGSQSPLTVPHAPTVKSVTSQQGSNCYGLVDAGFSYRECDEYTSPLGTAVAMVETQGRNERDLVWTIKGTRANLALREARTLPADQNGQAGADPAATHLTTGDLANDNTTKAIFYEPVATGTYTSAFQGVDVVEANGNVVLHRNLQGGVASQAFGGGLDTWTPDGAGYATYATFQYKSGAWRLAASERIATSALPTFTGNF